ncbi:hypothetical protein K523DRAFT_421435 [Schizophyllum commune Tattone D]|nr:hypothetical protein K523DRAFT_421435 [Schizophyllum commune Tattone D]
MAAPSELRVPLRPLDINGPDLSGITMGYVLRPGINEDALRSALFRVVDRWRLLAGHPVWDDAAQNWYISIPSPAHPLPTSPPPFHFTVSHVAGPLLHVQPVHDASATLLQSPPIAHFRHPDTVWAIRDVAARRFPFLAVHITHFDDYDCVGVNVPHALFDAVGLGQVLRAIDAEMHGKEWEVPLMYFGGNPVAKAVRDMEESEAMYEEEPTSLTYLKQVLVSKEPDGIKQFMERMEWEWNTQDVEYKAVYLGKDVVRDLVNNVNEELAKESGRKELASTGRPQHRDHRQYRARSPLHLHATRSLQPPATPSPPTPTTANTSSPSPHSPSPPSAPHPSPSSPRATRRALLAARHPASLQALLHWRERTGSLLNRRPGVDSWLVSNQGIGRFADIDFSVEMVGYWSWTSSVLSMDHILTINGFKGGYVMQAPMRRSRWEAVVRELEGLETRFGRSAEQGADSTDAKL